MSCNCSSGKYKGLGSLGNAMMLTTAQPTSYAIQPQYSLKQASFAVPLAPERTPLAVRSSSQVTQMSTSLAPAQPSSSPASSNYSSRDEGRAVPQDLLQDIEVRFDRPPPQPPAQTPAVYSAPTPAPYVAPVESSSTKWLLFGLLGLGGYWLYQNRKGSK